MKFEHPYIRVHADRSRIDCWVDQDALAAHISESVAELRRLGIHISVEESPAYVIDEGEAYWLVGGERLPACTSCGAPTDPTVDHDPEGDRTICGRCCTEPGCEGEK